MAVLDKDLPETWKLAIAKQIENNLLSRVSSQPLYKPSSHLFDCIMNMFWAQAPDPLKLISLLIVVHSPTDTHAPIPQIDELGLLHMWADSVLIKHGWHGRDQDPFFSRGLLALLVKILLHISFHHIAAAFPLFPIQTWARSWGRIFLSQSHLMCILASPSAVWVKPTFCHCTQA